MAVHILNQVPISFDCTHLNVDSGHLLASRVGESVVPMGPIQDVRTNMVTVPLLTRPLLAFFLEVFPLFSSSLRSLATSLTILPSSPLSILASPLLTSSLATLGQTH